MVGSLFDNAAKDLKRLRHIVAILAKYGYGQLAARVSPEAAPPEGETPEVVTVTGPRRFRLLLEELGPTYIKLGQVLSSRPDLIPRAYADELKSLQYQCEPLDYAEIDHALKLGLRKDPLDLFRSIDETPLATASIAQVHRAITIDGEQIVVKVQRPGIRDEIRADLDILYRFAQILVAAIEESAIADPVAIVREFDRAVTDELDFRIEAQNLREFARNHAGRADIAVPRVYDALSSDSVLTLEYLDGVPFTRLPEDAPKKEIARRILQEAFDEVFVDGFFHADPHPGNLLYLKDGRYGLLDFGVCGRLTPKMRDTLVVLALAVALKDADTAARTLYQLGQADERVSIAALSADLNALFARYLNRRIEDVSSTLLAQEIMNLVVRHHIRVPPEYTMLARAGATIEGTVREFDPDLDVAKEAAPYAQKLLFDGMGTNQLEGGLFRALLQLQGISRDVPNQLSQILSDLSAGNLLVNVHGKELERLSSAIFSASAVVAGAILSGAFVIGTFIALAAVDWKIVGVPIVALLGAAMTVATFGWMSAYWLVSPRIRKIRLSSVIERLKRG